MAGSATAVPVISPLAVQSSQDTGFGNIILNGAGLFFTTADEALAAIVMVASTMSGRRWRIVALHRNTSLLSRSWAMCSRIGLL